MVRLNFEVKTPESDKAPDSRMGGTVFLAVLLAVLSVYFVLPLATRVLSH